MKPVKTIAMVYRETGTCGGIQRGASFQVGQFGEWGFEPVVLSESDLGRGPGRREKLAAAIRGRGVDLVIEHDAYAEEKLSADIAATRDAGVPIIVFWHSVFSWMVANGSRNAGAIFDLLRRADAIIALTSADETFFRMIGCRSLAIPYCDADLMEGFERGGYPHRVLWMGRFVGLKRPLDAIKTVERLRETVRDAELVMLGDGAAGSRAALEKYVRSRPGLRGAVRFEGFRKDVRPYLESAGAGLVTSKFEGFSHATVEMKMASLPVVAYSMPYVETLAEGTGAFQVPQGDVDAAAARLAALFSDPAECARQGALARRSYEAIRSFDQRGAYGRLFADLEKPRSASSLTAPDASRVRLVAETLLEHAGMGLDASAERISRKLSGGGLLAALRRLSRWWR